MTRTPAELKADMRFATGILPLWRALCRPGATRDVVASAASQFPDEAKVQHGRANDAPGYSVRVKPGLMDRSLDRVVRASGSIPVFIFIQLLLVAWALLGIPFHDATIWPVIISDAQAIFSYIFDSFLMRQQLNGYNENLTVVAEVRSRARGSQRMLLLVRNQLGSKMHHTLASVSCRPMEQVHLPTENKFTKCITWSASALGHIYFIVFYWACIFLWLGFGPRQGWSNQWQLDINSATSVSLDGSSLRRLSSNSR